MRCYRGRIKFAEKCKENIALFRAVVLYALKCVIYQVINTAPLKLKICI